jgi:hypothetical protein
LGAGFAGVDFGGDVAVEGFVQHRGQWHGGGLWPGFWPLGVSF